MSGNYPDDVNQSEFDRAHNEMDERPELCATCGNQKRWRDCYNCEDGFSYHDCGDDSCCCLNPVDNVECDICEGEGGWLACALCVPED